VRRVGQADGGLTRRLTDLANEVYAVAERGPWRDDATRTTGDEVAALVDDGQIVVATEGRTLVGGVRVHDIAEGPRCAGTSSEGAD
jgi:hypothetical protein